MTFKDLCSKYVFSIILAVIILLMIVGGHRAYNFLISNIQISKNLSETDLNLPEFNVVEYEKLVKVKKPVSRK